MQKFAALCTVALQSAFTLELEASKGTLEMYVNNFEADVTQMPQGKGQDHTLWSWEGMIDFGNDKYWFYQQEVERT